MTWNEFATQQPDLAGKVRPLFEAAKHKTIATLRSDGAPRISGIECEFVEGQLTFGSMAPARKEADLRRDPRFALHSATVDPVDGKEADWPGEAKIAGRAVVVPPGPDDEGGSTAFRADITEVAFTHLDPAATKLIIEWWTPDGGYRTAERA